MAAKLYFILLAVFAVVLLAVFIGGLSLDCYILPSFVLMARFVERCANGLI